MNLSPEAVALAPWSPSKVNDANSCPFKFNCGRAKKPIKTFPNDSAARIGTALHSFIEVLLKDPQKAKEPGVYYSIFTENSLTFNEQTQFKLLKSVAEESVHRILKFKDGHGCLDEHLFIELALAIDKDFKPVEFFSDKVFMRGKVDVAMLLKNNTIVVLDHKSGSVTEINDDYKFQLTSYIILFYYSYLKKIEPTTPSPDSLYFINALGGSTPDIIKGDLIPSADFDKAIKNLFIETINSAALSAGTNEARPGGHCRFCNYVDICPAGVKL